jgi:hypothetical protein
MTAVELEQIAIDTFAEIKIFFRGHEWKKEEAIKGLRELLEFFECERKEQSEADIAAVANSRRERICIQCGKTPLTPIRWEAGHRICSECGKEQARAKGSS